MCYEEVSNLLVIVFHLTLRCIVIFTQQARLLFDASLDQLICQQREVTPLCVACEAGHAHVVKILIENKANLDLKLNVRYSMSFRFTCSTLKCPYFRQENQHFILLHIKDIATL